MNPLFAIVAYIGRRLWRNLTFTLVAMSIMAIGVALATTMFSVVNGLVLSGVPYPEGDRLVHICTVNQKTGDSEDWLPVRYFEELRRRQRSFETLAAHDELGSIILSGPEGPERLSLNKISANFLEALRVKPILGSGFLPGDDVFGAPPKVILSHEIWSGRFGGDPGIIGREIRADGKMTTVVAVMPPGFRFPNDENIWTPAKYNWGGSPGETDNGWNWILPFGRLNPGVSLETASREVDTLLAAMRRSDPIFDEDMGEFAPELVMRVTPFEDLFLSPELKRSTYVMLAATSRI